VCDEKVKNKAFQLLLVYVVSGTQYRLLL